MRSIFHSSYLFLAFEKNVCGGAERDDDMLCVLVVVCASCTCESVYICLCVYETLLVGGPFPLFSIG